MLKLLLDEHISPAEARGLVAAIEKVVVRYIAEWEAGDFLGRDDSACLIHAAAEGLTLVTYDRRTIPPLLKTWAGTRSAPRRVIFVDEKTVSPADIVQALGKLVKETAAWEWANRICFLRR